jgi:hypothetical protein
MSSKIFNATIVREGSTCFIPLDFDPKSIFGKVRAPVRVTLNGHTYRSTIAAMGGPPCIPLRKSNREAAVLLPLGIRQEVFAGRMFAALAAPYESAAKKAGDSLQSTVLPEAGHFVFIDPQSDVWPRVLTSVRRLLSISN